MVQLQNLKKNNILLKTKSSNRWDIINEILSLAVKNNEIQSKDKKHIYNDLVDREKSMSTGIGNGVAIPHCTSSRIDEIAIIFGINEKGIDFDSIDNKPVKIIIMLLVPKSKLTQHIKTLANIAKMMNNKELREKILTLKTTDSIIKTFKNY